MKKPPFNDFMANNHLQSSVILRREAAYLYDAVYLYAWSLKKSLLLNDNPLNGTAIIERLKNRSYKR